MTEEPTPTPAAPDEAAPNLDTTAADGEGAHESSVEPEATAEETGEPDSAAEATPPELDSEGEPIPESHTAFHGAPEGYELPTRLPEALEAERLAALPPEPDQEPASPE